jgi:hypothetical protein
VDFEDTRVVVIVLSPIPKANWLDWATQLEPALIAERSHFLHTLLTYQLPEHGAPGSRCFLPILHTEAKETAAVASLRPLNDEHAHLLRQAIDKATKGEWQGMLEHEAIVNLLDSVPAHSNSWRATWTKLLPHLKAAGLKPVSREFKKHCHSAAWGFAA